MPSKNPTCFFGIVTTNMLEKVKMTEPIKFKFNARPLNGMNF